MVGGARGQSELTAAHRLLCEKVDDDDWIADAVDDFFAAIPHDELPFIYGGLSRRLSPWICASCEKPCWLPLCRCAAHRNNHSHHPARNWSP